MNINLNELNFSNSIFSKNKPFEWPYGVSNAKEILESASGYTNLFDLLCDCQDLTGDLNFYNLHIYVYGELVGVYHNFSNHNEIDEGTYSALCLNEKADDLYKDLSICDWPYDKIIGSCIFCVLKDTIMNNNFGEKKIIGLRFIINHLTHLVLTKHLNSIFLTILSEIKVFECAEIECLSGFEIYFNELIKFNYKFSDILKSNSLEYSLESLKWFLCFLRASDSEIEKIITECNQTDSLKPVSNYIVKKKLYEKHKS